MLTKEFFIFRARETDQAWTPFYLLWALSLRAVRDQWRRVVLMQTNREDCGDRYREIMLPHPPSPSWADDMCHAFKAYFSTIATARATFIEQVAADGRDYVANVRAIAHVDAAEAATEEPADGDSAQ